MLRSIAVLTILAVPGAFAQQVISAQAGVVHYTEGQVQLDGQPLALSFGKFVMVKDSKTLSTRQGKAEVLLTPGVFLRLSEGSAMKMISSSLLNARVELSTGSALVEVAELGKDNSVAIKLGESETAVLRAGLYFFDADTERIRVYDGKAEVSLNGELALIGKGREIHLEAGLVPSKFDVKETDALYAWSQSRSALVAKANISAAGDAKKNGFRMSSSSWAWYPSMGILTFLPRSGYIHSPFGYSYYSPGSIWQYYAPNYNQGNQGYQNSGYGYDAGNRSWAGLGQSGGYSGGGSNSGAASPGYSASAGAARAAAPAPAAPAQTAPSGGRGR